MMASSLATCNSMSCPSLPPCSVMEVFLQWTPVVDQVDLTDQPIFLLAEGQVAPIPMIVVS